MEIIRYIEPPTVCGECFNRALSEATRHPEQMAVSVYCAHHRALLTAQLCDHQGERIIHAWNLTGPLSPEQAQQGIRQAAAAIDARTVTNNPTLN